MITNNITQMPPVFSFPENEEEILQFWKSIELYSDKIVNKNKDGQEFNFQDGPPFVSSANLHFGHIHISIMKSFLVNFLNMHNYNVLNKSGKDCHGLPIETIVSGHLGLKTNDEIKNYGLANYNNKCANTINEYAESWNPIFNRIGRFLDFKNEYYTMDLNYMESIWWAWKTLHDKKLVYSGYKIMPYSTACGTPISASEASGDDVFKEVTDTSIYIKFQLVDVNEPNTYLVVWTTTPWTLPSNLALAMNPNIEYCKIYDIATKEFYIIAKNCLENLYGKPKKKNNNTDNNKDNTKDTLYEIIEIFLGKELENRLYIPVFNYFVQGHKFKIIMADFVEAGSGTGIVHLAPAFGQDDFDACIMKNIITVENVGDYCPVNDNGFFTDPVVDYKGEHVLSTNKKIIEKMKQEQKLLKIEMYKHSYPFCWRTDTPLIYKAVSSYFVKVTEIRDRMVEHNETVNWVPETIGNGRFKQWLMNARDWGVSRSRFFGTPIPMWISDDGKETICVGSIDELVKLAGLTEKPTNLHPQYINHIIIPSLEGRGMLKHCNAVFDCWFESGCAPFAQLHYPFENTNFFDNKEFLTDFICEGLDQTRGWFYTLMVLSTGLFDKPAFKNVICSGLILAADGKKFSKRLGNFVSPLEVCNEYGADALRLYLTGSPAAHGDAFQFNEKYIKEISAKYFQLFNSFKYLIENLIKYEKDGNVFNIYAYIDSKNVMDNWILARMKSVLSNIETCMADYEFYKVKGEILDFIEDLTNWYIKFNRNRLRGRYCDVNEQGQALSTLYRVILMFSIISAPFMPFLAETIYKKLNVLLPIEEKKESVHLCVYPNVNEFLNDPIVERRMKHLQEVCKMVRSLRDKTKTATSIKVPLKTVVIINENEDFIEDLQVLERYMREEINGLDIIYKTTCGLSHYKLEPNNKDLGIVFKNDAKLIKSKLLELSQEEIINYVNNKEIGITLNGIGQDNKVIILNEPFFTVIKEQNLALGQNELTMVHDNTTIIIDHTYDNEVIELYTKRLLIVGIQEMRKNTRLRPWDKINIYYKSSSFIENVFLKFKNEIDQELNYPVLQMDGLHEHINKITESQFDVNGENVFIIITSYAS
jgi:isoleucyl-tRNA synthetase